MRQRPEALSQAAEKAVRDIKRATRQSVKGLVSAEQCRLASSG